MTRIRCGVAATAMLLLSPLLAACGAGDGGTTWTGYSYSNTVQTSYYKTIAALGEDFETATDGRVDMEMHPGGSLTIEATAITQAVGTGSVQFADDGFYEGNIPIAAVLSLPLLYDTDEAIEAGVDRALPVIQDAMREAGVEVLGYYIYPPQTIFTKSSVTSLDDLDGLKIRVSSPQQAEFVKAVGGEPITIGTPEVAPALQQGVIDGVLTASAGGATAYADQVPFNYRLPVSWKVSLTIVNSDSFSQLSEEDQQAVRDIVEEKVTQEITPRLKEEEAAAVEKFSQEGMQVTEVSDEEVANARSLVRDYWQSWAEDQGADAQTLLEEVLDTQDPA